LHLHHDESEPMHYITNVVLLTRASADQNSRKKAQKAQKTKGDHVVTMILDRNSHFFFVPFVPFRGKETDMWHVIGRIESSC
jgi:hypothetical protein